MLRLLFATFHGLARPMRNNLAGGIAVAAISLALGTAPAADAGDPRAADTMALGRKVFTQMAVPQCGVCHALGDAGTTGEIGAKLDEIKPDAVRVANAVRGGVGVMPSYDGKLTEEQIKAVAQYVARVTGGAGK